MSDLESKLSQHEASEDYFSAVEVLEQLTQANPDNVELLYRLAVHLLKVGQVDLAETHIRDCITRGFQHPMLYLNLGHILKALGRSSEAVECYQRLVDGDDDIIAGIGYWSLADLKDHKFDDASVICLKTRLQTVDAKPVYKGLMLFALACALEQREEYAQAFRAMSEANDILAMNRPFRGDRYEQLIHSLTKDFRSPVRPAEIEGPVPILIVGMPRSGTTLVEQILSSHSQVEATNELPYLGRIGLELEKKSGYASEMSKFNQAKQKAYADQYLSNVAHYRRENLSHFVDKNPANFLHIGLAKSLFPKVKIINVVRDPLDNAMSVYKQYFNRGNDYSYSMEGIVYYWQGYLTLMRHWNELYRKDIYHLSYEDLTRRPDEKIKKLLRYCELSEEPDCFRFYESRRPVLTPSASQVRNPISARSVGSGLQYKPFIPSFMPQFALIKSKVREVLGI